MWCSKRMPFLSRITPYLLASLSGASPTLIPISSHLSPPISPPSISPLLPSPSSSNLSNNQSLSPSLSSPSSQQTPPFRHLSSCISPPSSQLPPSISSPNISTRQLFPSLSFLLPSQKFPSISPPLKTYFRKIFHPHRLVKQSSPRALLPSKSILGRSLLHIVLPILLTLPSHLLHSNHPLSPPMIRPSLPPIPPASSPPSPAHSHHLQP